MLVTLELESVVECASLCAAGYLSATHNVLQCVAVCCSELQCVAVCCSVLQCVAVCCSAYWYSYAMSHASLCATGCVKCVAVCCSMLQRVAVCCSVLQRCSYL